GDIGRGSVGRPERPILVDEVPETVRLEKENLRRGKIGFADTAQECVGGRPESFQRRCGRIEHLPSAARVGAGVKHMVSTAGENDRGILDGKMIEGFRSGPKKDWSIHEPGRI